MASTSSEEQTGPRKRRFEWARPPEMPPDGRLSLIDHVREIRYRVIVVVLILALGMVAGGVFYQELYNFLLSPLNTAIHLLNESRPGAEVRPVNTGVAAPLTLALKMVAIASAVVTSPLWLYQVWAFMAPGLLAKEKKWSLAFIGAAAPLFIGGVLVAYWVMPKAISVLLSFTPESAEVVNMLEMPTFMGFMLQLMLVFGLAFLMPVVVVALNFAGVVTGKQLGEIRSYVVLGSFVFAAVATPSTDPFSMLALALPMTVLYVIAEFIARVHDRRKAKREAAAEAEYQKSRALSS